MLPFHRLNPMSMSYSLKWRYDFYKGKLHDCFCTRKWLNSITFLICMNHDIKWNFELWISISRLARCMPGGLFVCCCFVYIGFAYPLNLSLTSPCGQLLRQTMPINQMSTWQLYLSMELIQFTICFAGVFFFYFLTTIWNTWISQCCWQ